uniref:Uncharacterized protein n=1 Tax=Oryza sativa subsp. japonica TaxID=39947 RepID=Q6Z5D4_ORYSJ|nr:hypothetical protein [Oryza sativa Japonica Group]
MERVTCMGGRWRRGQRQKAALPLRVGAAEPPRAPPPGWTATASPWAASSLCLQAGSLPLRSRLRRHSTMRLGRRTRRGRPAAMPSLSLNVGPPLRSRLRCRSTMRLGRRAAATR